MKSFLFICQIILFITPLFGGVIEDGLKQISPTDKWLLKEFISWNIKWNQALHVTGFDNKPCCLTNVILNSQNNYIGYCLWNRALLTFKKHENFFPHPNYIFNQKDFDEESGSQIKELLIVNKRALKICLQRHSKIFENKLGKKCSVTWFENELKEKKSINEIIQNDQILLGILLGYGEDSSTAFHEHENDNLGHYFLKPEIYSAIKPEEPENCGIHAVVFTGNKNSLEAQELLSLYKEELDTFWNIYKKRDPLIIFLECICEQQVNSLERTFNSQKKSIGEFSYHVLLNPFSMNYLN